MEKGQLDLFDVFKQPEFILHSQVFPETESDEIEYKSGQGGLPVDLWKTYSSFVNTSGGIIVLGIVEKKNQFTIEGLSDEQINKLQKDFWNQINNKKAVSRNILDNHHVKSFEIEGKKVLAFHIPQGSRTQKPLFLTENPFGNTYKRNYEGDYRCTEEEIRRMMADADLSFQPDGRILEGYTMDDFDLNSLRQYRQILSSSKPGHPWLALDDIEFLKQLGGYRIDRKTQKEGPTVAGILMFGKSLSITDEECCPKFFPDYREYLSENPNDRWTDRVYADGTWETNLFQFYRTVWLKLSSRLPKPFQLSNGQRIDETPAHEALREAFVNSLVHTDYSAPGNIVIESRLETFIFSNPGTLLVTLEQYYAGGISQCRNISLQKMLMMIGSAEKAGSGVGKILSGWTNAHWRRPYLSVESKPDRLELYLSMLSTIPEETFSELKNLFGDIVASLDGDEMMVLSACQIEGDITNQKLQYLVDRHKTDITKLLQDLCRREFLISDNRGRWTTYHLNETYRVKQGSSNIDSSNIDSSNEDSSNMDSSKQGSSKQGSSKQGSFKQGSIPQRLKKEELIQLIKEVCKEVYKSLEEIAKDVDRKMKYLSDEIFPDMIQNKDLIKLYQDNHPNQKYKSTDQ